MERHQPPVIVETERLRGEPLRPDHAEALRPLLEDERVGATLGGVLTAEQIRTSVEHMAEHWARHGLGYWTWFERATGACVGRGGLHQTHVGGRDEVEVGWAVMADRWGEGFATEIGRASAEDAFGRLALLDVVAFTLPDNHSSRRVMQKLGFVYERDVLHAGSPHVLCRLRRDTRP
jgi:ribosomal-protein-alanine N-acetyltransferase